MDQHRQEGRQSHEEGQGQGTVVEGSIRAEVVVEVGVTGQGQDRDHAENGDEVGVDQGARNTRVFPLT